MSKKRDEARQRLWDVIEWNASGGGLGQEGCDEVAAAMNAFEDVVEGEAKKAVQRGQTQPKEQVSDGLPVNSYRLAVNWPE